MASGFNDITAYPRLRKMTAKGRNTHTIAGDITPWLNVYQLCSKKYLRFLNHAVLDLRLSSNRQRDARSGTRRLPARSQLLGSRENGLHDWFLRRNGVRSALRRFFRSQIWPEGARTDPECWQSDATGRWHIWNIHVHRNCN